MWITRTDMLLLNHPWIAKVSPTWLWCMILLYITGHDLLIFCLEFMTLCSWRRVAYGNPESLNLVTFTQRNWAFVSGPGSTQDLGVLPWILQSPFRVLSECKSLWFNSLTLPWAVGLVSRLQRCPQRLPLGQSCLVLHCNLFFFICKG